MSNMDAIAVIAEPESGELVDRAASLARTLGLPMVANCKFSPGPQSETGKPGFCAALVVTSARLELREVASQPGRAFSKRFGPAIWADFVGGRLGHRASTPGGGAAMLRRAVGFKAAPWQVCDATAGLARDAFLLASIGCAVTAIERSAVVAALVADGVARARQLADAAVLASLGRIQWIAADSRQWLAAFNKNGTVPDRPDVVYLDPMFPARRKSALVKKEMRLCRLVAGDDGDAGELLELARSAATARVVVKRPVGAAPLAEGVAYEYAGRTIRYDVYLPKG
jgi:16S rRNA (guanine1516-N2)-methyltransferase